LTQISDICRCYDRGLLDKDMSDMTILAALLIITNVLTYVYIKNKDKWEENLLWLKIIKVVEAYI